jgi:iron(II)-dependent oxidoreductase
MPVGSFKDGASPVGCLDMIGNAAEWCSDWFSETYYKDAPAVDPKGPEKGTGRVYRGGSYESEPGYFFASTRAHEAQDKGRDSIGFRIAR